MSDTRQPVTPSLQQRFAGTRPLLSPVAEQFMQARDLYAHEKILAEHFEQRQDEIKLRDGQLSTDQVSRIVNVPRSILQAQAEKQRHARQAVEQLIFMAMLSDLKQRLDDLESRMADQMVSLKEKYGDDVARAMAETFLTEEECAGLETEDQQFRALANKFLDEYGNIKDEYKHLEEAQYVRDWHEAQTIKRALDKYEGVNDPSPEDVQELEAFLINAGQGTQENAYLSLNQTTQRETAEQVMSDNRQTQARQDDGVSPFTFGK